MLLKYHNQSSLPPCVGSAVPEIFLFSEKQCFYPK